MTTPPQLSNVDTATAAASLFEYFQNYLSGTLTFLTSITLVAAFIGIAWLVTWKLVLSKINFFRELVGLDPLPSSSSRQSKRQKQERQEDKSSGSSSARVMTRSQSRNRRGLLKTPSSSPSPSPSRRNVRFSDQED